MRAALAGVLAAAMLLAVATVMSAGGRDVLLEEANFASSPNAAGARGRSLGRGKARQQQLSGIYGLDFGSESGVAEGIDESKDEIRGIKMMAGTMDDDSNPLQKKLQRIERQTGLFLKKEEKFYKKLDAPAQTDISVKQGPPGKPGKRGYRSVSIPWRQKRLCMCRQRDANTR